ncbi:MAG: hypothetical protein ABSD48_07895 [Armatimonadota bacterium]
MRTHICVMMIGKRPRADRGFALISAVMFLVLILALGSSMLDQTVQEVATGSRVKKETRAFHLAEAGIDYAAWQLYNLQTVTLPVTWTRGDLGTGTFSTTVDKFNGSATTFAITSTGTSEGYASQVKVIGSFLSAGGGGSTQNAVFNSALFSNSNLSMNGNFTVTGGTFSNGNTSMNGNATISGNVGSVGTIKTNGNAHIGGARTPGAAKISMPVIDTTHYKNEATQTFSTGKSFNGNTALNGVVYVNGNCSINGNFSGTGMIVATGTVTINGNAKLVNPNSSDSFAIVAGGGVTINGNSTIQGWIYTHNVSNSDSFSGNGNATVTGGIAADVISVNGNFTLTYKQPSNSLDLPGAAAAPAQFGEISWRRVK